MTIDFGLNKEEEDECAACHFLNYRVKNLRTKIEVKQRIRFPPPLKNTSRISLDFEEVPKDSTFELTKESRKISQKGSNMGSKEAYKLHSV